MAILRSTAILLVDSIPTHTPTAEQAKLARLQDTLTLYYYDGTSWVTKDLGSTGGSSADSITIADVGDNYTSTDVEGALNEIAVQVTGISSTAITNIDLVSTANPNEYVVQITWTDGDGNTQTTTDATPVVITGAVESEPTGYLSKAAATSALGVGAKFQYLAANLDGAVEGTVAWT